MFGRGKSAASTVDAPPERPGAKNKPTPKRSVAEAANRRPLVPSDRKAAGKMSREEVREARLRQRQAMLSGDERYLPARDKGPERRFVRDFVDARWSLGEFLLPALAIILLSSITRVPIVLFVAYVVMYGFVLLVFLDSMWMLRKLKKAMREKFGVASRGLGMYAVLRSVQLRRWRMPRAMVARGETPH